MGLFVQVTKKPLDCFDIVKCLDYDEGSKKKEYFEVKQLNDVTHRTRLTGNKTTEQQWLYAVYYTWMGGGETGPRRVSRRLEFDTDEEAREFIERLRKKEIFNGSHRESIDIIGDECATV